MFQVLNHTPFQAAVAPLFDKDGSDVAVCAVKATFTLPEKGNKLKLADEQLPVLYAETYFDTPDNSGLKYPADLILGKPNTDIGLIGSVYSPKGKPAEKVTASLQVGANLKKIMAYGDRFWTKSLIGTGFTMTKPNPFLKMPISCNRLFGGKDEDAKGNLRVFETNPHGTGFFMTKKNVGGSRIPNFERPDNRISNWRNRPLPATFGFAGPSWPHRLKYAGTYDDHWKNNHWPLYPEDLDERFFNGAQKELVTKGYLSGGETVILRNLTPSGGHSFVLPLLDMRLTFHMKNDPIVRKARLFTVMIEPDEKRFYMVWAASIPMGKQRSDLRYAEADIMKGGV